MASLSLCQLALCSNLCSSHNLTHNNTTNVKGWTLLLTWALKQLPLITKKGQSLWLKQKCWLNAIPALKQHCKEVYTWDQKVCCFVLSCVFFFMSSSYLEYYVPCVVLTKVKRKIADKGLNSKRRMFKKWSVPVTCTSVFFVWNSCILLSRLLKLCSNFVFSHLIKYQCATDFAKSRGGKRHRYKQENHSILMQKINK